MNLSRMNTPTGQALQATNPGNPPLEKTSIKRGNPFLPHRMDVEGVSARLQSLVTSSPTLEKLFSGIMALLLEQKLCQGLYVSDRQESGYSLPKQLTLANGQPTVSLKPAQLQSAVDAILDTPGLKISAVASDSRRYWVAVPVYPKVRQEQGPGWILIGDFAGSLPEIQQMAWLMSHAAQAIGKFALTHAVAQLGQEHRQAVEKLNFTNEIMTCQTVEQAARRIVNQLRKSLNAAHVSIAIDGQLAAVSDVEQFDLQSETMQVTQAACLVAAQTGQRVDFGPDVRELSDSQHRLQAFCRAFQVEACSSLLLPATRSRGRSKPLATLLIGGPAIPFAASDTLADIERSTASWGNCLDLLVQSKRSLRGVLQDRFVELFNHHWRNTLVLAVMLLTLVLMIPLPYRIACDCEIQPVSRRFVVSPFDAVLERTFVKHGDIVEKDQIIARLDGRHLRLELAAIEAEYAGARKKYDVELANGNVALSQIAKSEQERLKARIDLLQRQMNELNICSPIDGMVIHGDLDKVEGASLTIGQPMFEIAPLDEMIVEVAIPESEIQYANASMEVALKLNAFPFQKWHGSLESIHPRAELVEHQSVFIGQMTLPNTEGQLRPGMKGTAKIKSDWAPLGWNLFHRPWETIRHWTIW